MIAGTEEEEILRTGRVHEQKTAALPVRASGGDKQSDGEAVREEKAAHASLLALSRTL